MRRYLAILAALLFFSCKNGSPDSDPAKDDSLVGGDTTAVVPTPTANDTIFTAFGNEPFWALYVIRDQKLLFHPMDGPDVEAPYVSPVDVDATTQRYQSAGDSATLELVIIKKDCSDGMSDLTHRFETKVKVNAVTYQGCGRE
jgi:uncharacterized membrane protein